MSGRLFLGEIVAHGSGYALHKPGEPVMVISGLAPAAFTFRQAFGRPQPHDIGKRVYRVASNVWQMENDEQRAARLAREKSA